MIRGKIPTPDMWRKVKNPVRTAESFRENRQEPSGLGEKRLPKRYMAVKDKLYMQSRWNYKTDSPTPPNKDNASSDMTEKIRSPSSHLTCQIAPT